MSFLEKNKIPLNKIVFFLAIVFSIYSCDSSRVFEENKHIPDGVWVNKILAEFEFEITDTSSLHNIYLNIRHNTDYQYSNLFLFVDSYYPNGSHSRDTIECLLADVDGRWFGKGLGKIKENQILLNQAVYFPLRGQYKFSFEQAMREKELPGIEDIGVRIEKMQDH